MRVLRLLGGLLAAVVVHLLLVAIAPGTAAVLDPFLLLIAFNSMDGNLVMAYAGGAAVGLTQDALTGGLYGVHGVAGTVVGYAGARAAQLLTLQRGYYIALFFAAAVLIQALVLQGLLLALQESPELLSLRQLVLRVAIMGPAGGLLATTAGRAGEAFRSWRGRRPRRVSLE